MTDDQPWHSLTEAARLTGLDREAIRSRARRDLLPSRKNNRGELLVQLPAELLVVRCRRKIPFGQEPSEAAARLPEPGRGHQLLASHH
jgi:hypothetical protein